MGKITKKVRSFCEEQPELTSMIFVSSAVCMSMFMGYRLGQYKIVADIEDKLLGELLDEYRGLKTKYDDLLGVK